MISAPRLAAEDLERLVAFVGGPRVASRALGIPLAVLREWLNTKNPPHWAPRLLWFHTSDARNAFAEDIAVELRYVAGERDALRQERERREQLLDEGRATLAARVKALEIENHELRSLLQADVLTEQLVTARAALDRLLVALSGKQQGARAA
jgi:hypothetical protein